MVRPVIPLDRQGYMIVGSTVHTRYATHVERGMRLRTSDEAFDAVARTEYTVCEDCYPPPKVKTPRRPTASRPAAPSRSPRPPRVAVTESPLLPNIDDLVEGS